MNQLGFWMDSEKTPSELLILDHFPKPRSEPQPEIEARFAIVQRVVSSVRQLRATSNIKDNLKITIAVKALNEATKPMLERANDAICYLARLDGIRFVEERAKGMAAQYDKDFELYIDLGKYLDLNEEVTRITKMIGKTEGEIKACEGTLANPNFSKRAPRERVKAKEDQLDSARLQLDKLNASHRELSELIS
ncbi:MAG TPA: hypothetical protein EYN66_08960 [Myxococcales bacterium]|nr:hypothetical protein [Myxococcales bacterium]